MLYPLPGLSDMDSPLSEDYVVLAPGRLEPLVSLHWKEPESNGLDVCRWDTNRASVFFSGCFIHVIKQPGESSLSPGFPLRRSALLHAKSFHQQHTRNLSFQPWGTFEKQISPNKRDRSLCPKHESGGSYVIERRIGRGGVWKKIRAKGGDGADEEGRCRLPDAVDAPLRTISVDALRKVAIQGLTLGYR